MYQKYTTEAIVLAARERGEADKSVTLLTKDFGLLYARAIGARKEASRMRYALVPGAVARVSLVRGKHEWRVAGAMAQGASLHEGAVHVFARVTGLLNRLVKGEEGDNLLFATVLNAREALGGATKKDSLASIELLAVARVLHALGYISAEAVGSALFTQTVFTPEMAAETERARAALLGAVNSALAASQL